MDDDLQAVDVQAEPGLYEVLTASTTVYYVDTREAAPAPLMMRARGDGPTGIGEHDNKWVRLTGLTSGPCLVRDGVQLRGEEVDQDDVRKWVIRVGARHTYDYYVPGGFADSTDFWWVQRVCERIRRLEELPQGLAGIPHPTKR